MSRIRASLELAKSSNRLTTRWPRVAATSTWRRPSLGPLRGRLCSRQRRLRRGRARTAAAVPAGARAGGPARARRAARAPTRPPASLRLPSRRDGAGARLL